MEDQESNYFKTVSGSNTLFLLASFEEGHKVLYYILKSDKLAVNIFSSGHAILPITAATKEQTISQRANFYYSNNTLKILLHQKKFDLYHLLLNRFLFYSRYHGVGGYTTLTDTLLYLQENNQRGKFET